MSKQPIELLLLKIEVMSKMYLYWVTPNLNTHQLGLV